MTAESRRIKSPAESDCSGESRTSFQLFVAKIPHKKIAQMGRALGRVLYGLDVRHRRIVRRNLKFAFPEWEWREVHRVTKQVFQNFAITALEILQISCSSFQEVREKAHTIQGLENISDLPNTQGIIIISAHLGNWEVSGHYVSTISNAPLVAVARKIRFKPFERWINRLRTRFGGELIDKKGALPKMREALRRGKNLGVLIDQGGEGAKAKFFGHDVQAHAALALLALRCKNPVIPAFCVREKDGFRIIIEPPIALQRTTDLRSDIQVNIQLMMDAIEKAIRLYPDQWFWFHKRWKVYYPHLYREDLEKRRLKQKRRNCKKQQAPS